MSEPVSFTISFPQGKSLTFTNATQGLIINGQEYLALADGALVYEKTSGLTADSATCQLSTNISTLIPALRTIGLSYHPYFDEPEVVASQNNISFYWAACRLAAYYNRYSTDHLDYPAREPVIKPAVAFLQKTARSGDNFLPQEMLAKTAEPVTLLGFYEGFPIFDDRHGFAKLLSRLGIHVDQHEVMISTPLDEHAETVANLGRRLETKLLISPLYKKNRVVFPSDPRLLRELKLDSHV